jgi:hypothetical protein
MILISKKIFIHIPCFHSPSLLTPSQQHSDDPSNEEDEYDSENEASDKGADYGNQSGYIFA